MVGALNQLEVAARSQRLPSNHLARQYLPNGPWPGNHRCMRHRRTDRPAFFPETRRLAQSDAATRWSPPAWPCIWPAR